MENESDERMDEENVKGEKAETLIDRICQYKDLARTAKEAGRYVGRSATTWMCNGDEVMEKWSERRAIIYIIWLIFMKVFAYRFRCTIT